MPLHCKAAPHLRCITAERLTAAHTDDTRPAASATTHRHNGIATQAPPHTPSAPRRGTPRLRLHTGRLHLAPCLIRSSKGREIARSFLHTLSRKLPATTGRNLPALGFDRSYAPSFGRATDRDCGGLSVCHLRREQPRHTPRLPPHQPDALLRFANDFAERGLAGIIMERGITQSTNPAASSGFHRTSADISTGICRDLRTTCARSDYRANGITALSARQGAAVGAVTYSARKFRSDPKKAAGRGGIVRSTLGGKYSPEPPLRLIKRCFSGLQRF